MIELVEAVSHVTLEDCAKNAHLRPAVHELQREADELAPRLEGRTVWMVNSAARGGGVAEMLPRVVHLLEQVGVRTRWAVIGTERAEFFPLTKHIHNLIHGSGQPHLGQHERALYESVSRDLAEELGHHVGPDDILVVHDPQPAGAGSILAAERGLKSIWRCHIGLDQRTDETSAAWRFLEPYLRDFDHAVFSAPEYIPDFFAGRASIIHPALDPTSHKNRDLSPIKLTGVLCNAGLVPEQAPIVAPPFEHQAKRLSQSGTFGSAVEPDPIGLLFRPIVSQVSRWDRLKGFGPLLAGFVRMKELLHRGVLELDARQEQRLNIVRLVLAGPDPLSVQDDPEAVEVLDEIQTAYQALDPKIAADIAILSLPMESLKENALMVNAIQRASSVVVQNSLREGFGLVVTEAMWKRTPVVATNACGIRQQLRDRIDGILVEDAQDPEAIANGLLEMLSDPNQRAQYAASAQRRVFDEFLVFGQVRRWLRLLVQVAGVGAPRSSRPPPRRSSKSPSPSTRRPSGSGDAPPPPSRKGGR